MLSYNCYLVFRKIIYYRCISRLHDVAIPSRVSFTCHQELSKYIQTRWYTSACNVSLSTHIYTYEYYAYIYVYAIKGHFRFNVRCPIRYMYLPLQPGSGHDPFTPGGIHKSNKVTVQVEKEGKREGGGEGCLACRCSRVSLYARPFLAFIIIFRLVITRGC